MKNKKKIYIGIGVLAIVLITIIVILGSLKKDDNKKVNEENNHSNSTEEKIKVYLCSKLMSENEYVKKYYIVESEVKEDVLQKRTVKIKTIYTEAEDYENAKNGAKEKEANDVEKSLIEIYREEIIKNDDPFGIKITYEEYKRSLEEQEYICK